MTHLSIFPESAVFRRSFDKNVGQIFSFPPSTTYFHITKASRIAASKYLPDPEILFGVVTDGRFQSRGIRDKMEELPYNIDITFKLHDTPTISTRQDHALRLRMGSKPRWSRQKMTIAASHLRPVPSKRRAFSFR